MKHFLVLFLLLISINVYANEYYNFNLDFSTFWGGTSQEQSSEIVVDAEGYIYVAGGTNSIDFPTTPGAYSRTFTNGGTDIGNVGHSNGVITKFSPDGNLIWSTYLGCPNYTKIYAIKVDSAGYVYVAGMTGPGHPTTPDCIQPDFRGAEFEMYGLQSSFITKILPDGSALSWSTYLGPVGSIRDMDIDRNGNIYVAPGLLDTTGALPNAWFNNAYQKKPNGSNQTLILKIKSDGSEVIWATWFGGTGAQIKTDYEQNVYIAMNVSSNDFPTTENAFCRSYKGSGDVYVAKLSADGSQLIYGTYIGGSGEEFLDTHRLAVDSTGNAYISIVTKSADYPTTTGAFATTPFNGPNFVAISKISPTGGLLASTFLGGGNMMKSDGISIGKSGDVFITFNTEATDFPVTKNAYQATNSGDNDIIFALLSNDLSKLIYASYIGGYEYDCCRSCFIDKDENLYILGGGYDGWPVFNAVQSAYSGPLCYAGYGLGDGVIAKFSRAPNSVAEQNPSKSADKFEIIPNPVTEFIRLSDIDFKTSELIQIFSLDGNQVMQIEAQDCIDVRGLPAGIYFLKINGNVYKFVKL